jgi:hypothetical protein
VSAADSELSQDWIGKSNCISISRIYKLLGSIVQLGNEWLHLVDGDPWKGYSGRFGRPFDVLNEAVQGATVRDIVVYLNVAR